MLVVIRHLGRHRRDVATDKAQDIDFMNQVGQDRTSLAVTTPGRGVIVVILARCPLTAYRHQPADAATLDDVPRHSCAWIISPLMANKHLTFLLRGVACHLVGLFHGRGDRLFNQHRLAIFESRHHIGVVTLCRGGNDDRLDIRL